MSTNKKVAPEAATYLKGRTVMFSIFLITEWSVENRFHSNIHENKTADDQRK